MTCPTQNCEYQIILKIVDDLPVTHYWCCYHGQTIQEIHKDAT